MNSLRIAFAVVSLLSATPVSAHGALRPAESACLLKIGPDFIYFSGYQPAASRRKFCEDIPTTGDTIFALDFGPPEMREMKAELRILRDAGDDRSLASTVAFLPPKVYPNGTLNFEHGFREAGDYLGVVTVDGPHGEHWVAEFPFSVGKLYSARAPYFLIAIATALAVLLFVTKADDPLKTPKNN
jgi:hypothetical protein